MSELKLPVSGNMLTNCNLKLPYIIISYKDSNISASHCASSEVQSGPTLFLVFVFPLVSCTKLRRQVRRDTSRLSCAVKINGL